MLKRCNVFEKAFKDWYDKVQKVKWNMQKECEDAVFPQDVLIHEMAKHFSKYFVPRKLKK